MSGTALDHPLVRDYLRDLDQALAALPPEQASELTEQITAHLDEALLLVAPQASHHLNPGGHALQLVRQIRRDVKEA